MTELCQRVSLVKKSSLQRSIALNVDSNLYASLLTELVRSMKEQANIDKGEWPIDTTAGPFQRKTLHILFYYMISSGDEWFVSTLKIYIFESDFYKVAKELFPAA